MTGRPDWKAGALFYSGRPDPVWVVAAQDATALVTAFEGLTMTRAPVPSQSRLGYRGAWLQSAEGARWNAFMQVLWHQRDRRADAGRALERRLLESAPPGVLPDDWRSWLAAAEQR